MVVEFIDEARREFLDAVDHYETAHPGLGRRFETAVRDALNRLAEFPESAPFITSRVRRLRLTRFPYGLVYVLRNDRLIVIAVMHLHRRPGYWRSRLQ